METKVKTLCMKIFILVYLILGISGLYIAIKTENILFLIIMTVLILIFSIPGLYFSIKLDFQSFALKVQPSVKMLNVRCFEDFKNQLFQGAEQEGFCDMETILSKDGLETVLAFKPEHQKISVLQIFLMDEFDEDILGKMTDLFWEKTEKKVGKRKIGNYIVQLIQCVCVGRMNEQAMEYVHRNLFQNIWQYRSISVIAFEESQAYICQTDNKYFNKEFRNVENLFLKIAKDIL